VPVLMGGEHGGAAGVADGVAHREVVALGVGHPVLDGAVVDVDDVDNVVARAAHVSFCECHPPRRRMGGKL